MLGAASVYLKTKGKRVPETRVTGFLQGKGGSCGRGKKGGYLQAGEKLLKFQIQITLGIILMMQFTSSELK